MNFIDHFNQDQEEAKSALTAALNQKAFDIEKSSLFEKRKIK